MKLCVAILLMTIGVSWATIDGPGQPGCKTDVEMQVKYYRNLWDATRYWSCEIKGEAALSVKCDDYQAWVDSQKKCVDWDDWVWEDPVYPPSQA